MNFCSHCGSSAIVSQIPQGDTRRRFTCADCNAVFYENPKIVAACILEWQEKILLCRRAIEPRKGMWTVPGGFLENNESMVEGAFREAKEESGATAEGLKLFSIHNIKHAHQVYVTYCGRLGGGICSAEHETSEVALYGKNEIPWDEVAFAVIKEALRLYVSDGRNDCSAVYQGDIVKNNDGTFHVTRY